jgi:transcriptional regulator with XRE-family HTH domain
MPAIRNQPLGPTQAQRLKLRRVELGLTQEQLSAATAEAVSQRTVSHLERGKFNLGDLAFSRVIALAQALQWSFDDLKNIVGIYDDDDNKGDSVDFSLSESRSEGALVIGFGWVKGGLEK